MSEILVRFAHISDTHIEPEAGTRERRLATLARLKGMAGFPPAVLAEIIKHQEAALDGHYPYPTAVKASEALVAALNALETPLDFVLHTGDVVNHGDADQYVETAAIFAKLNYPIRYAVGNHDKVENLYAGLLNQPAEKIAYDYTFEQNGVKFVCVDSATNGEGINWFVTQAQLAWLEAELTDGSDQPLVVAIHHPPFQIHIEWLDFFIVKNWQEIQTVLQKAGPRLRGVFSGHVHTPITCQRNGVLYSVVPEVFSHAPGYSVVTVTTEDIHIQRYTF